MILIAVTIIGVAALAAAVVFDGRFDAADESFIAERGRGHIQNLPAKHLELN
jgi:hypothetical protein